MAFKSPVVAGARVVVRTCSLAIPAMAVQNVLARAHFDAASSRSAAVVKDFFKSVWKRVMASVVAAAAAMNSGCPRISADPASLNWIRADWGTDAGKG